MPVINGVYTKDFPALGRAPIDTDIIPIAEVANQITYKTTIGAIFNAKVFGTTGRLSKFTSANTLGNSILNEIGNAIHLTNAGSSFASFGIINPGTPGDPGVDNDGYIGSTINNDFTIRVNNTEAARFDTALRFKIANIQNATTDTDKFLVSDGGIVKYRTGTELRSDIGAGVGSVTSVGLTMPVAFSVANSPITSSGTLDVTAIGTASQYIRGDGQLATLPTGGGGGSSVYYYLNGSVAASVATYKQMDNTAVIGAGTDFNLTDNGLIAQFLTDVGNPNRLEIPGGAWNFEMFFSMSSSGGAPKFYVELLKYNGTTFTSIASNSAVPETISGGTPTDLYLSSLAVPTTTLLLTDRLAVRVYIVNNSGGRTATLHTENGNLCQVITTFAGGISAINGLTSNNQYFAVGTSGTDFNISSVTDTHTFNLPTASATNRGALSSANWTTFNNKQDALSGTGIVKSTAGVISYLTDPLPIANGGTGSATQNFVDLTNNQTIAGTKTFTTASRTIFTNSDFFQVEFSNGSSKLNLGSATGESYIYSSGDLRFGTNYPTDSLSSPKVTIATSGLVTITNQLRLNSTITNGTYTYTLPSATGTLALTSNITSAISGTTNYIPKFTSANVIGNSIVYDNGTNVGIGTISPSVKLTVKGAATAGLNETINIETGGVAAEDGGSLSFTLGGFISSYPNWRIGQIGAIYESTNSFNGALVFKTSTAADGGTIKMRLSSSGNLGLGVTPSAWFTGSVAFQIGATGSLSARSGTTETVGLSSNAILNTSGNWQYIISGAASLYESFGGSHIWRTAPSGTAGNAITFTQAMTLTAGGVLTLPSTGSVEIGYGSVQGAYKLDVNGTGRFSDILSVFVGGANTRIANFSTSTYGSTRGLRINTYTSSDGGGDCAVEFDSGISGYGGFKFSNSGTPLLTLASTGAATFSSSVTATAFFESSDSRLKTLITDNHQAKGIESITAKLYTKNGVEELGYFAQDVQSVLPSAVIERDDTYLDLSYRQVHTAKIANLEKEIKELKDLIKQLI